jgi:hypothetical protein
MSRAYRMNGEKSNVMGFWWENQKKETTRNTYT